MFSQDQSLSGSCAGTTAGYEMSICNIEEWETIRQEVFRNLFACQRTACLWPDPHDLVPYNIWETREGNRLFVILFQTFPYIVHCLTQGSTREQYFSLHRGLVFAPGTTLVDDAGLKGTTWGPLKEEPFVWSCTGAASWSGAAAATQIEYALKGKSLREGVSLQSRLYKYRCADVCLCGLLKLDGSQYCQAKTFDLIWL